MTTKELYGEIISLKAMLNQKEKEFEDHCNKIAQEKARFKVGDKVQNIYGSLLIAKIKAYYRRSEDIIVVEYLGRKLTKTGKEDQRGYSNSTLYEDSTMDYFDKYVAPFKKETV